MSKTNVRWCAVVCVCMCLCPYMHHFMCLCACLCPCMHHCMCMCVCMCHCECVFVSMYALLHVHVCLYVSLWVCVCVSEAGITPEDALEVLKIVSGEGWTAAPSQSAWELLQQEQSLPSIVTFCAKLDEMLGGGIALRKVTEICGAPGIGKTQMGYDSQSWCKNVMSSFGPSFFLDFFHAWLVC